MDLIRCSRTPAVTNSETWQSSWSFLLKASLPTDSDIGAEVHADLRAPESVPCASIEKVELLLRLSAVPTTDPAKAKKSKFGQESSTAELAKSEIIPEMDDEIWHCESLGPGIIPKRDDAVLHCAPLESEIIPEMDDEFWHCEPIEGIFSGLSKALFDSPDSFSPTCVKPTSEEDFILLDDISSASPSHNLFMPDYSMLHSGTGELIESCSNEDDIIFSQVHGSTSIYSLPAKPSRSSLKRSFSQLFPSSEAPEAHALTLNTDLSLACKLVKASLHVLVGGHNGRRLGAARGIQVERPYPDLPLCRIAPALFCPGFKEVSLSPSPPTKA